MKNIIKIFKNLSTPILIICIVLLTASSLNSSFATTVNVDNTARDAQQGLNNIDNNETKLFTPENYTGNGNEGIDITKNITLERSCLTDSATMNTQELTRIFRMEENININNTDSRKTSVFNISSKVSSKVSKTTTYKATTNSTQGVKEFSTSNNTGFAGDSESTIQTNSRVISTNLKSVNGPKSNIKNIKVVKVYSNSKERNIKVYSIVKNKKGKLVKKVNLVSKRAITEAYVIKKSFTLMDARIETVYYSGSKNGLDYSNKRMFNVSTKLNRVVGVVGTWVKVTPDNYLMCRWFQQRTYTVTYKKGDCAYKTYINGKLTKITKKKGVNYIVKSKITNIENKNVLTSTQMLTNQNLSSTLDCNIDNPKIKKQVKAIYKRLSDSEKKSEVAVSNAIFKWMSKNVKYDYTDLLKGSEPDKIYYSGTRLGSDKMIDKKMGNCLDHSHLAAAMFRVAGIPTGYEYKYRADGHSHVWNRIFINKKWIAADTVIKNENKVRSRSEWVNGEIMNNNISNHLLTFDYSFHKTMNYKNVSWDQFWCSIENQTIHWKDGKVEQIYWKSIYKK